MQYQSKQDGIKLGQSQVIDLIKEIQKDKTP